MPSKGVASCFVRVVRAPGVAKRRSACRHIWEFPSPLPLDGTPCPYCGTVYRMPQWMKDAALAADRQLLEDLRAVFEIWSLPLQADDHLITATAAGRDKVRLARKRGWITDEQAAAAEAELEDDDALELAGEPGL